MRVHAGTSDAVRILALGAVLSLIAASCGAATGSTGPDAGTSSLPVAVATLPPAQGTAPAQASPPAQATATAQASVPASSATPGSGVIALGKKVFETAGPAGLGCQECHGPDGKGSRATDGTTAPSIRGTTEVKLRNALAGGAALMTNIKLSDQEIEAVLAYLQYLDLQ